MQEIDYFTRLELADHNKPNSTIELSTPKIEPVGPTPKKKKRRSKRCIPRICSTVDVAESRFTYRNLKADIKRS
ncbi:hypothetical protein PHJA_001144300 [Phtheirospermum japonicum]|uniref:Uncharacterized protein n=1 Tax=Phtheirospermum japonicum TaxID=374723 RepID=A0A830C3T5_9LAMI|nr:hypothetical protein PHJA_001144300 [Phtheirospermum japonicum]